MAKKKARRKKPTPPRRRKPGRKVGGLLADGVAEQEAAEARSAEDEMSERAIEDLLDTISPEAQELAGITVGPITMATLSLLEKSNSLFVTGGHKDAVEHTNEEGETGKAITQDDAIEEIAKFLFIQNTEMPIKERARIVLGDPEVFQIALLELMDGIPAHRCEDLMLTITRSIIAIKETMVKPADSEKKAASPEGEEEEAEGNS